MKKIKIAIAGLALAVAALAVNGLSINVHHNVNGLAGHVQTSQH